MASDPLWTHLFERNTSLSTHRYTANKTKPAENNLNPKDSDSNSKLMTSTNIFIYANEQIVGMIQSFSVSESRTINKLQAIGWEGVVQSVPSNTNGGQLQVSRIALYESNLWNALGLTTDGIPMNKLGSLGLREKSATREKWDTPKHTNIETGKLVSSRMVFKTLKDQRTPLEIQVKTRRTGQGDSASDYYVETYIDCWLSNYSKSFNVGTITVAEQATIQYSDVY